MRELSRRDLFDPLNWRVFMADSITPASRVAETVVPPRPRRLLASWGFWLAAGLGLGAVVLLAWLVGGNPNPSAGGTEAAVLDIAILVFREGLECILVLAAITAGNSAAIRSTRQPIAAGVGVGCVATLITWYAAVRVLDDLGGHLSALALQAATGLLAIVVLLVVMNWFFHKLYWTGWISFHSKRRTKLMQEGGQGASRALWLGMALLGFTSLYREGFEVVLFLQGYRLRLGEATVMAGTAVGVLLSLAVAALTVALHRRLPYRKMLVGTGVLLGVVLLVMVGEQAQEMQLAHWLPTTPLPLHIPAWLGMWFSVFPTVETLAAQGLAAALVLGSYFFVSRKA